MINTPSKSNNVGYCAKNDLSVGKDQTFSLSVTLNSLQSSVRVEFRASENGRDGYMLKIQNSFIAFYRMGDEPRIMASHNTVVKPDRAYSFSFVFNDSYCTIYFHDDIEGIEPWPEFDLKIDLFQRFHIVLSEETGYGALFEDFRIMPTEKQATYKTTYLNPIIKDHADPDILYHDGVYYLFATSKGYDCYTSTDLVNWEYIGKALPKGGWGIDNQYWAPDVEEIGGRFYMAVSFGEEGFGIAVADHPQGPYECQGNAPLLKMTIDGHIFVDDDGKVYLYYTSWDNGRSYGIYGVEMADDLITPKWETERKILAPTKDWEKHEGDIIEAPYMLKHNGLYYMIYSASHTKSKHYAVGYAVSESPLSAFRKSDDSPILALTSDVHGTGHCSVITAPDHKTMLIVYHCHNSTNEAYPRHTCIDRIRFVPAENGIDRLEVWGPTSRKNGATWLESDVLAT